MKRKEKHTFYNYQFKHTACRHEICPPRAVIAQNGIEYRTPLYWFR